MPDLAANALLDVGEAAVFLKLGDVSGDTNTLLQQLINSVSSWIENECHTIFLKQTAIQEKQTGGPNGRLGGAKRMYLRKYPIVAVTEIKDDEGTAIAAADYTIIADQGILEHDNVWPIPVGRWNVKYDAGRYADLAAVPFDLKNAAAALIGMMMDNPSNAVSGIRVGSLSVSYREADMSRELPPAVAGLLAPYKAVLV